MIYMHVGLPELKSLGHSVKAVEEEAPITNGAIDFNSEVHVVYLETA